MGAKKDIPRNGLVGLRRSDIGQGIFRLSTLNLKTDLTTVTLAKPGAKPGTGFTHVEHVLFKVAFMFKTVATFVQKVGLIWLKGSFLLQLLRTQI